MADRSFLACANAQDVNSCRAAILLLDQGREVIVLRQHQTRGERPYGSVDGRRARRKALYDLRLCAGDRLAAAQKSDVARANVGNRSDGRAHDTRETRELAFVVHPHLADDDLIIGRGRQDGEWHPHEVVVVSRRRMDAPACPQAEGDHVLCRGLANGAGNAHDRPLRIAPAPLGSKPEKELRRIVASRPKNGAASSLRLAQQPRWGLTRQRHCRDARLDGC